MQAPFSWRKTNVRTAVGGRATRNTATNWFDRAADTPGECATQRNIHPRSPVGFICQRATQSFEETSELPASMQVWSAARRCNIPASKRKLAALKVASLCDAAVLQRLATRPCGGVPLHSAGHNGKTEFPTSCFSRRGIHSALRDLAQKVQQFRRLERCNRTAADRGQGIRIETSEDPGSLVGATRTFPVFVPVAREGFEGIVSRNLCGPLTLLFHYGRIEVSSKVMLGYIPRSTRAPSSQ